MLQRWLDGGLFAPRGAGRPAEGPLGVSILQRYRDLRRRLKQDRKAKRGAARRLELAAASGIPPWFNPQIPAALAEPREKPCIIFQSHIAGSTDKLLALLHDDRYELVDLELFLDINDPRTRNQVNRFANRRPALYTMLILGKLARVRRQINLAVLTFDWHPVPRQLAAACAELGIPTVLVPHEGAYADRARYYVHPSTGIGAPICDLALCWGVMQQSIFVSRGYPARRTAVTGAPKFDYLATLKASAVDRAAVARLGLNPDRQVIAFAMQPLDSQFDETAAREQQNSAVLDLLDAAAASQAQVIVRLPRNGADVLSSEAAARSTVAEGVAVDGLDRYRLTAEETIAVADIVVSINSTMLLEAALAGRVAISAKYVDFEQMWDGLRIAVARDRAAMMTVVRDAVNDPSLITGRYDTEWAARELSAGGFDGDAARRIRGILGEVVSRDRTLEVFNSGEGFASGERRSIATAGIWRESVLLASHQHMQKLLGVERMLAPISDDDAVAVDVMLQWGLAPTVNKQRLARLAGLVLRPLLYLEDGFLRSVAIGLDQTPGLSVIIDDRTSYYDSSRPSRLESLLASPAEFPAEEVVRARRLIASIRRHRLSKYNHAPDRQDIAPVSDRRTILLVDQRFGDASVEFGGANEESFRRMLNDALADPQVRVVAKLHPDAIGGGKGSYLGPLVAERADPRLIVVDYDLNPHALFDVADEVWVATSGLGFEALMAGKRVRCYGVPYYSGWGVTDDMTPCSRRTRQRTVEEIFAVAWLRLSRYINPTTGERGEIEDVIEHLAAAVRARGASEGRPAVDPRQSPWEAASALAAGRQD